MPGNCHAGATWSNRRPTLSSRAWFVRNRPSPCRLLPFRRRRRAPIVLKHASLGSKQGAIAQPSSRSLCGTLVSTRNRGRPHQPARAERGHLAITIAT